MAIWKEIDGWVYEYFELDTPAEKFDGFEPIVNLWNSKRSGNDIPSWSNFDFYDFVNWHGKVSKSTYLYNPFDFKVDLFGIDFVELLGFDMTGYKCSELLKLDQENALDVEFYEWIYKNRYISRYYGSFSLEGHGPIKANIIDLPLSDDGKNITHSLEILLPD